MRYQLVIGQNRYDVDIQSIREGVALVTVNTKSYEVAIENYSEVMGNLPAAASSMPAPSRTAPAAAPRAAAPPPGAASLTPAAAQAGALGVIMAPIPGLIIDVFVKVGDQVSAGHVVLTMEAMKMLNNITSSVAGAVREVRVQKGSEVSTGDVLVVIG